MKIKHILATATLGLALYAGSAVSADQIDYVVKAGDTLSTIAERELGSVAYVDAIAEANGIKNKDLIHVGQELTFDGVTDGTYSVPEYSAPAQAYSATVETYTTETYAAPAQTYSAPVQTYSAPSGSVVLSNGNTAGETGLYAAQQMEARTGVPASTWEYIIARESNGQVNAYNPSGASGLFQTMPGWGSTATVEDQINAAVNAYNNQGLSAWGY